MGNLRKMSIDDLNIFDSSEDDLEENGNDDLNLWGDLDDYFEDEISRVIHFIYISAPKYSHKKDYMIYKN